MCQCVGTLFRENGDSLLDLFCKSITMLCTWEWITNPSANMTQWNERFILFVCGVRLRYCMPFIVYSYSRLHPVLRFIPSLSSSHTWCMGVSWFFPFCTMCVCVSVILDRCECWAHCSRAISNICLFHLILLHAFRYTYIAYQISKLLFPSFYFPFCSLFPCGSKFP